MRDQQAIDPYDAPEMNVLARMKHIMITRHGWEPDDFAEMSFLDIEAEFLDGCGEPDFRAPTQ